MVAIGGTLRAGWYTEEGEGRVGTRRIKKVRSPKRRQSWGSSSSSYCGGGCLGLETLADSRIYKGNKS